MTFFSNRSSLLFKTNLLVITWLVSSIDFFYSSVWNRDVNSATNIYRIAKNAINVIEQPKYLSRVKKNETNKIENPKKNKIKKVVQKKNNKSVKVDALTKS